MLANPIDTLLRLVPDSPSTVLTHLTTNPTLAASSDSTGYSLLHAAASYTQLDLLRTLITTYHVSANITDTEGETPLFYAETLAAATCLVEEFNADISIQNEEDITAERNALQNMDDGGEWAAVADYLEKKRTHGQSTSNGNENANTALNARDGAFGGAFSVRLQQDLGSDNVHAPPPMPNGVKINVGTMQEAPLEGEGAPDPDFRRRIEELAARENFQGEEGQRDLRALVEEAIGGFAAASSGRDVRRRIE